MKSKELKNLPIFLALILTGCGGDFPRKVKVIEVNPGDGYANTYLPALQVTHTTIEDEQGFRSIVPGDYGEPGDEFFLPEHRNEIGGR